ncbi:hypothetical protein CHRY9390_00491 [Chryseobacterium aquaeductus]|uniref:Uncharacterized protein n=1 Tax=Chryseobacterium aquaeductus TaxID=2675056 RepID=A0A9N8MLF6_9FLAO|nr:hypothetical protein [Chryseobacterium aquaeductus]CAA7329843.1 hypothetical protein CHRY9390_00491 [Chryseobacterium potabilaquae]CAD7799471.1 hypothetical protein CHRY9390_00491 [Chryseobacterium aquaeductus]
MKKEQVTRDFNLADSVLKQKADELIALIDRDITEFTDRGYNAAKKTELTSALNTVDSFPSDEQLEAIKTNLTEQKDDARNALEKTMRSIFNMAENVFGQYSAKYKEFGNALISQQSDAELVRVAKIMSLTAKKYLPELSDEGLTTDKINTLITQRDTLDVAIDVQAKGISDRDVATESRVEALNKLYQLLTKYTGIGRDIFYETNEAKYNDYIIYDTPSGLPETPPTDPV